MFHAAIAERMRDKAKFITGRSLAEGPDYLE
jgi:hypothetical protein